MDSGPGDAGSSPDELPQAALDTALERLVGECRAWLLQVECHLDDPSGPQHLEHVASELLCSLNELVLEVPPPRHLRRRRRRS